jgi:hypothetical protein
MKNQALPCLLVVLLMAVLCVGCRPASSPVETVGGHSFNSPDCYQVEFLGVTESSEVASTWRYRVQSQACKQNLSSWMLELPACASVVDASPTPWGTVSQDLNYQMSGIKWQSGADFQNGEFSVTLTGDLEKGMTRAGVEGQNVSVGSLDGPVCRERAAAAVGVPVTGSPVAGGPMAKVKVQSAYCRARPVGKSGKVTLLYRNQEAEIVGRNEDPNNTWWYVKIPDQAGNCWLWGKTSTTSGNVEGLPILK